MLCFGADCFSKECEESILNMSSEIKEVIDSLCK